MKFSVDEEGDSEGGKKGKVTPKRRITSAGAGGRRPALKK